MLRLEIAKLVGDIGPGMHTLSNTNITKYYCSAHGKFEYQ